MKKPARPAYTCRPRFNRSVPAALIALSLLAGGAGSQVVAAPVQPNAIAMSQVQNVDWMSPEAAASLDIGMDVLVPSWVPQPFSGVTPSVTASNGYYQIYWMVPGGAPTFLYIEGTVGGSLPAGSPADLNKELTVNASVQGWNAIHDIGIPAGGATPIYDQVWWIANGVLYTVSSSNMTGSDSLSLANSLIVLESPGASVPTEPEYLPPTEPEHLPPAVPSAEPVPVQEEPVSNETNAQTATVSESGGVESQTMGEAVLVTAPQIDSAAGSMDEVDAASGSSGTGASTTSTGGIDQGPWSPGRYESGIPSDGTNGPRPPLVGGDGTGGVYDTALPNIFIRP